MLLELNLIALRGRSFEDADCVDGQVGREMQMKSENGRGLGVRQSHRRSIAAHTALEAGVKAPLKGRDALHWQEATELAATPSDNGLHRQGQTWMETSIVFHDFTSTKMRSQHITSKSFKQSPEQAGAS
jgi:hypothetical protein